MYAYLLEVDAHLGDQSDWMALGNTWDDDGEWDDEGAWSDETASVGGVQTLRLSTHTITTRPTETPANTTYDGRITEAGSFSRSLISGGRLGRASDSWGSLELANTDGGLDPWLDYGFDGRTFTLKALEARGQPVAQATTLFRGTVAALESGNAADTLRLRIRDRLAELAIPLLTARYAGTAVSGGVGVEGGTDLQDQLKPRVYGSAPNVPPKLVNQYDLIYQVSDSPVASIAAYDGAAALTRDGDYPVVSSMLAATVAPGHFVTCYALGLFRLGGTPALTVTADVVEDATDLSAAGIVSRVLDDLGVTDVDQDSLDELAAFNPATVGIFLDTEATALDVITQVLGSVGGAISPSPEGLFQVTGLPAPTAAASVGELTLRDLVEGGSFAFGVGPDEAGVPAWSVVLNYGRVWQTMTEGQLAGIVNEDLARRTYLASQWRKATAEDASIKVKHLLASQITVDTLLVLQADAQAEAARQLALYSVRRDVLAFPTNIDRGPYELGDVVTVTLPRFGYDDGRPMLVVGRHIDADKRTVTLDLWG